MKVLHVIPSVGPHRGGPSQVVLAMVRSLRESGIEAEIATTNDNGAELLKVPLCQKSTYQTVPIWFFSRFSPPISSLREFAFSSSFTIWLIAHIHDYDLVHVHAVFSYVSTTAMTVARLQGIPVITSLHGLLCHWSLQQGNLKKQLYLRLIEKANLNSCRALHFTAKAEYQEVERLALRPPGVVIPLGLTLPKALPEPRSRLRDRLNLPRDQSIILFLGRLHPKKGIDYLISALGQLKAYRFTLLIAGSGDPAYEVEIQTRINAAGLADRTYLTGFVEGEDKQLLLQGSDLFALTSHSENFGISILEAMASGLPVLVTPGVALAPVVQSHHLGTVTELAVDEIVKALEMYLRNSELSQTTGAQARQFVQAHYTWDKIAADLIQVYEAIIEKKPIPPSLLARA